MSCSDNPLDLSTLGSEMSYMPPYGMISQYQARPKLPGLTPAQALPTGIPTGPPFGGAPLTTFPPVTTPSSQPPQTIQSPYFTPGYLRRFIGRDVRVEFLIGTGGPLVDRIGTLLEVGASYIVIRPIRTDDTMMCDLYSIKFVTIYA